MNWKKTLTLIGFAAVMATAATFLFAATPKDPGEGKFHLVYLVAAVDLKPGSKVTVDPIFFTDGKRVVNFHDFCRNQEKPLNSEKVTTDQKIIEDYCARKTFTSDPREYHTLNNHGQQVTLGPIEFKVRDVAPGNQEVMMGQSAVSSFTPGSIRPPKWLRKDGAPEYFFLLSRDKRVLEKIVPVFRAPDSEVQALVGRALEFSKLAKGKIAGGPPLHIRDINQAKGCHSSPSIFRLENALFADLDRDGKLDMQVTAYVVVKAERVVGQPLVDCFTKYMILGNGDTYLIGSTQWMRSSEDSQGTTVGGYKGYLRNGYALYAPLIAVRLYQPNEISVYSLYYIPSLEIPGFGMQHPHGVQLLSSDYRRGFSLYKYKSEMHY